MTDSLRPARLDWSQGMPFATDYSDIYFSCAGGDAETIHVFIEQNNLPLRFQALASDAGFTIIETGFGTGLNWLAALDAWQKNSRHGWLHFVSVEKHPLTPADLQKAQGCWPQYAAFADALQKNYPPLVPGFHRLVFPQWRSTLTLFWGDVADFMPRLCATADAWFLDGFSPEHNADMWTGALYQGMAAHSHAGTTLATFTAAGHVRRGLIAAGFVMEKSPGHGKKREILRGCMDAENLPAPVCRQPWLGRPAPPAEHTRSRQAVIIGAGIAGASTAAALARRGWKITVLEKNHIASAASGNPAAVVYLTPAASGEQLDHFPQQASVHALEALHHELGQNPIWQACGVLELAVAARRKSAGQSRDTIPMTLLSKVDAHAASVHTGLALKEGGQWQPGAGMLDASAYCRHLLNHPGISVHENREACALELTNRQWEIRDGQSGLLAQAPVVIIAASHEARIFSQSGHFPLRIVRGQIATAAPSPLSKKLRTIICHRGYITPALGNGTHCLGASFVPDDAAMEIRASEHQEILQQLEEALPELAASLPRENWQGRTSLRCQSPDYLPLVGPVADAQTMQVDYAGIQHGRQKSHPLLTTLPGLYANLAHGSRGFSQALLAAEILASELNSEPAPVSRKVLDALHPMRFLSRQLKRMKPE
ncbi:MAG: bifunctional tRNA (5-methylaminomethyl-2-thiouridine)(34)-methyltransferase MnmD/FAD-dependent 5-carboxymethylaminomethyl-2-thiouridine(34) oxidoreductase MnmC [bacterium]|nr:bifunctional tRNA (5-methylaminomethyl-2-thiouridine)(34)-methyltransferase MnmD/FAD-dependent 5-carboxymethylaminomethyl-2-thiouridine(34) oxidoreductase MnmC [bacterium]